MPRRARDADGLTSQEAKYCVFRARGASQRSAYEQAFPKSRANDNSIDTIASRLEKRVEIHSRIRELLKASKAADLISQGEWTAWVTDIAREAHAAKQYAAAGSLVRLLGQANGTLKEHGLGQSHLGFSEENLLERLAAGNPALKAQLAALLGKPTFQKPDSSDTKH
jgi:hypothetical protein